MNATDFLDRVIFPQAQVFTSLVPTVPVGREACVMLLAIAGQESDWSNRRQVGGPARSYWQFERAGGVAEVMEKTPVQLRMVAAWDEIPYVAATLFEAMAWNDLLAFTFARLLLWQDRAPLPLVGAQGTAWAYYLRNWRPGLPDADRWAKVYPEACAAVAAIGRG